MSWTNISEPSTNYSQVSSVSSGTRASGFPIGLLLGLTYTIGEPTNADWISSGNNSTTWLVGSNTTTNWS